MKHCKVNTTALRGNKGTNQPTNHTHGTRTCCSIESCCFTVRVSQLLLQMGQTTIIIYITACHQNTYISTDCMYKECVFPNILLTQSQYKNRVISCFSELDVSGYKISEMLYLSKNLYTYSEQEETDTPLTWECID